MVKVCRLIFVLLVCAFLSSFSGIRGGEPDGKPTEVKGYSGLWDEQTRELDGVASDLLAKASSVSILDKKFVVADSCIAAVLCETGTYSIVRMGRDRLEVDVKVRMELSTDLGKQPPQKINR